MEAFIYISLSHTPNDAVEGFKLQGDLLLSELERSDDDAHLPIGIYPEQRRRQQMISESVTFDTGVGVSRTSTR